MKRLLLLLALLPVLVCSQKKTIKGYLKDASTSEMLIGASVFNLKTGQGTSTNTYGFFSLTQPANDTVVVRFSYVGYQPVTHVFVLRSDTALNVLLKSSVELDEFEVISTQAEKIQDRTQMSSIDLSMDKVKSLPVLLGEKDVMKTIQLLPGVQSGSEGTSGLYVRGGGPDQNLILLDGVPVYNASHLFGFFSVFNADAINNVQLIKGGFPARYGGRLSSVIDIRMKEGNMKEMHGEGSIGIIASKLTLEGPIKKDKTSFIVSGRRTYIDLLAQPIIKAQNNGQPSGYFFYDVNAKLNHVFSDKSRLFLSSYFGNDKFYFRNKSSYLDGGIEYASVDESKMNWGNIINALRWNYVINDKLFSNTTITYSRYKFLVGFSSEETEKGVGINNKEVTSFAYFSGIEDWGGKIDFDYIPSPNHYIRFGVGETYHTFTPGVNQFKQTGDAANAIDTSFGSAKQFAHEFYTYIEDEIKLGSRTNLNVGAHLSGFVVRNKMYFVPQPRLAARYLLDEHSSVKASFATMSQFLHLLTNTSIGLPTDLWVPATDNVVPQQSAQAAVGYARTVKKDYELSIEAYYKTMNNLIEYKEGASFFGNDKDWQEKVESGIGWSYGGELLLEKKVGKTTGWIGYTLSWTNRQFANINLGEKFPYRYDRRHDIGLAVTHKFNDRVDVGVVWVYGTGNAVTLALERYQDLLDPVSFFGGGNVEHISSRNNYRMGAYHRLDLGVNLHKKTKWGERTWSFSAYNAYSRQNPFFLYFDNDTQGNRGLYQVSLFPIIPAFAYSFKF
ncbi:MAG: TonB-dependent receptor [Flavobacteriales bacterium]